jgi:hypothetical protein
MDDKLSATITIERSVSPIEKVDLLSKLSNKKAKDKRRPLLSTASPVYDLPLVRPNTLK